ncbi:hypothetical protein [Pantoea sp. MBLJ3]|jgi:hypothetical protein|uniref:hypothetical protein n=1 Tax=Pantoea sp. MBLJ3 TaxID=1562889 RepID=UPI00057DF351|nr:hypothetical protein [Pantoea sp. MBLJ3]
MPTLSERNYETPKSWAEFESICKDSFQLRWSNPDLTMHGRQGQAQDGVDIYGNNSSNFFVGIQCKNTIDGISESLIDSECSKAEKFSPLINILYIATTAKRDVHIQRYARNLSVDRRGKGKFPVEIVFWEDVCLDLARDQSVLRKHFPEYNVKPTKSELMREKDLSNLQCLLSFFDVVNTLQQLETDGKYIAEPIRAQYEYIHNVITSPVFKLNNPDIERDTAAVLNDWYKLMLMLNDAPYRYNDANRCFIFIMPGDFCRTPEESDLFDKITAQMAVLRNSIGNFCDNINSNFHEIDLNKTSLQARRLYA